LSIFFPTEITLLAIIEKEWILDEEHSPFFVIAVAVFELFRGFQFFFDEISPSLIGVFDSP